MTDSAEARQRIVHLATDLMLGSTVSGHVAAVGKEYRSASTSEEAITLVSENDNCRLLVDLDTAGLDVAAFCNSLRPDILAAAVAYGPHIHIAKLEAAKSSGFGSVISRGRFSAEVRQLVE